MAKTANSTVEARLNEAMIKFEREYMGRGPFRSKTYIIEDLVIVRLEGVLTPAEQQLTKETDGIKLLKDVRAKLIENASQMLAGVVKEITGREVISMHSDISARAGERLIVFTLKTG